MDYTDYTLEEIVAELRQEVFRLNRDLAAALLLEKFWRLRCLLGTTPENGVTPRGTIRANGITPRPLRGAITYKGETLSATQWAARTGLSANTIRSRLYDLSWPVERALTEPASMAPRPGRGSYSPHVGPGRRPRVAGAAI